MMEEYDVVPAAIPNIGVDVGGAPLQKKPIPGLHEFNIFFINDDLVRLQEI
jgi:hypothetical protein